MTLARMVLQEKVRCSVCRCKLVDGMEVQILKNGNGKIKEYRCKLHEQEEVVNEGTGS
jgi:hypothetical protein